MAGFHRTELNQALVRAVREAGRAATPHELEQRGVRRVRCVSTEQVSRLIESAVEETLRKRAAGGIQPGELDTMLDHAQLGLLGLLQGCADVEDSRGAIRAHRRELEGELAELRRGGGDDTIDRLERRIAKLVRSLEETEAALQRVASMKNIDLGIASLYRVVQGLDSGDQRAEEKRSMMRRIFEANVVLQQKRALAAV